MGEKSENAEAGRQTRAQAISKNDEKGGRQPSTRVGDFVKKWANAQRGGPATQKD